MQEPTIEMQAKLFAALSKAQGAVGPATKDRRGQIGTQTYKYADLEAVASAVDKALVDNGLAIIFVPGMFSEGTIGLTATILHAEGGQLNYPMSFPVDLTYPKAGSPYYSAQNVGKVLTYARRYAKVGILDIVTEDEDGNQQQGNGNRTPQNQPEMGTPTTTFTPVTFPEEPRQPGLGALTGNQIRALISNTKFPSSGIVGAYLKNDGALGPIVDAQVEAWSSDNEGADGMALLRAAAGYASANLDGEISKRAKVWLAENQ
jgi:hypothetical protein